MLYPKFIDRENKFVLPNSAFKVNEKTLCSIFSYKAVSLLETMSSADMTAKRKLLVCYWTT